MAYEVISVTFRIDAQSHSDGQFSVPKEICDILHVKGEQYIDLEIDGHPKVTKKLSSGTEIYGADIRELVSAGSNILVTASRPASA